MGGRGWRHKVGLKKSRGIEREREKRRELEKAIEVKKTAIVRQWVGESENKERTRVINKERRQKWSEREKDREDEEAGGKR